MVGGGGFEPPKSWTADLQSAPFGRSGILPYMELVNGIEPSTYWLQINCSAWLSYTSTFGWCWDKKKSQWMVLRSGIEPPTRGFSVPCSTYWATEAKHWRPGRGSNPRPPAWQAGVLTNCTTGPKISSIVLHWCFAFGGPSGTWTPDQSVMSRPLWPTELKARNLHGTVGRSEETRTPDILLPKQARYQLRYTPLLSTSAWLSYNTFHLMSTFFWQFFKTFSKILR